MVAIIEEPYLPDLGARLRIYPSTRRDRLLSYSPVKTSESPVGFRRKSWTLYSILFLVGAILLLTARFFSAFR